MDTVSTPGELDVLTDEEMARVVGGADARKVSTQEAFYRLHKICGCGRDH